MITSLRFTEADIDDFAAASGDVNPLHVSAAYARSTPMGRRVVHGALVATRALEAALPEGMVVNSLRADFETPVVTGCTYEVVSSATDNTVEAVVRDGLLLKARVSATLDAAAAMQGWDVGPLLAPRDSARESGAFNDGNSAIIGPYHPDLRELRLPPGMHLAAVGMCAASYLAGMEAPGLQALLRRIVIDDIRHPATPSPLRLALTLRSRASLARGAVRYSVEALAQDGSAILHLDIAAFLRTPVRPPRQPPALPSPDGALAVVAGSSRGFGAAMLAALVDRDTAVVGLQRTPSGSEHHRACDLANADDGIRVASRLASAGVSLLVLNAASALEEQTIDEAHLLRITKYLQHETALVLNPLTAFLPLLEESEGTCLLVSTAFLDDQAPWPAPHHVSHYLAAKRAQEAFMLGASQAYPSVRFLIARLPPLDTAFAFRSSIDTAYDPDRIASRLVELAADSGMPGTVTVIPSSEFVDLS